MYGDRRPHAVSVLLPDGEYHLFGPMPKLSAVLLAQMVNLVWSEKFADDKGGWVHAAAVPIEEGDFSAMEILARLGFFEKELSGDGA